MRILLILIIAFGLMFGLIKRRKVIILVFAVVFLPVLISTIKVFFRNPQNHINAGNALIALILLAGIFFSIFRIRKKKRRDKFEI